ncbi:nuclear factor 7, brain-like isoform X2 [Sander lucioperca]|uniref:nuclear factor 7, brain-like isoform X2 n=1 Tax=Sander lucioperca TaxID=283035 RepID=UPI00165343DB|nr:nuclear factor 7, brain-like isoform X2 [Sander lucioperca]
MSAASSLLTEDQFLCSICLDVFTDPVTIPCGHNFCKACITDHWDIDLPYQCPTCRKGFNMKPKLQVNTLISEMAAKFRQSAQLIPEEVPRDVYSGFKLKTWMFFLACLMCVFMAWMLIETIKEKQKTTEKLAEGFVKDLKQEISELKKRITEVEQLYVAQQEKLRKQKNLLIETIKEKQKTTEKLAEGFNNDVKQEISELKKRSTEVEQFYKAQLEKLSEQIMKLLPESDLKRVQQYEVDVTLDPDTAHPRLILSDDRKQVHDSDVRKNLPDNPERYETHVFVLAKQSFSSRRFYYEVQVKGKTAWLFGAARESINRKGKITLRPQDGYWTIWLGNDNEYYALDDPAVHLSLKSRPQKVGVFVDYEEGLVSFYDVDAEALIYSFTGCSFTEKLYPFFSPCLNDGGKNSAPLIISPVSH